MIGDRAHFAQLDNASHSNPGDKELAEVKLSDDEARALEGLERALGAEEPRLHARLRAT